jgi:hypothetical protein
VAASRAALALISAPMIWPPQMTSRDLVPMMADYSASEPITQSTTVRCSFSASPPLDWSRWPNVSSRGWNLSMGGQSSRGFRPECPKASAGRKPIQQVGGLRPPLGPFKWATGGGRSPLSYPSGPPVKLRFRCERSHLTGSPGAIFRQIRAARQLCSNEYWTCMRPRHSPPA